MKNVLLAVSLIALLTAPCFSQNPPPVIENDDDVVKISTSLIQVDVSVTDKDGKQVTDLKPEDFEIYEDGKQREISNFSYVSVNVPTSGASETTTRKTDQAEAEKNLPPVPTTLKPGQVRRTIALVVDDFGIAFAGNKFVKDTLKRFVNEQMQPGDLVAVIRASGGSGVFQQFTSDKRLLLASIDQIKPNLFKVTSFLQATNVAAAAKNKKYDALMNANYALGALGAMNYVIKGMEQLPGRKTIILFSEGFRLFQRPEQKEPQSSGGAGNGFLNATTNEVETNFGDRLTNDVAIRDLYSEIGDASRVLTEYANRAGVVINTIDARGLSVPMKEAGDGFFTAGKTDGGLLAEAAALGEIVQDREEILLDTQASLRYLAAETGGRAFFNNGFTTAIQKSIDDQNGYYLIGYQPDEETFDVEKRRFNRFSVRVKNRPNLTVRYRSGFFGIADDKLANKKPLVTGGAGDLAQALFSPFDVGGIDLELTPIFSNAGRPDANSVNALLHIRGEDLNFKQETGGERKGEFEIFAVTLDAGGKAVDRVSKAYSLNLSEKDYQKLAAKGLVYMMNIPLKKPGAYQLKVAVRDTDSGKIGSSSQFLDIPNLNKKRLALSGILLQSFTPQELLAKMRKNGNASAEDSENNRIQSDTANRRFKSGTNLNFGYEIYGAKINSGGAARVQSQVRLFAENQLIYESPKESLVLRKENLRKESVITLGSDLKPGYYLLQVLVTDDSAKGEDRTATQWIGFEITG